MVTEAIAVLAEVTAQAAQEAPAQEAPQVTVTLPVVVTPDDADCYSFGKERKSTHIVLDVFRPFRANVKDAEGNITPTGDFLTPSQMQSRIASAIHGMPEYRRMKITLSRGAGKERVSTVYTARKVSSVKTDAGASGMKIVLGILQADNRTFVPWNAIIAQVTGLEYDR